MPHRLRLDVPNETSPMDTTRSHEAIHDALNRVRDYPTRKRPPELWKTLIGCSTIDSTASSGLDGFVYADLIGIETP